MTRQGVILAGGTATRLGPLTKVLNKHLLPIGDKPMLMHDLDLMRDLGMDDVVIILGGNSVGDIVNLVKDGEDWGLNVTYRYQRDSRGISDALYLAKNVLKPGKFLVLLGDNVFGTLPQIESWYHHPNQALVVTAEVPNPQEYGQAIYDDVDKIVGFVEKKRQGHNKIITGLYGFDSSVFDIISKQQYSSRSELEIMDTLSAYIPDVYSVLYDGYWADCGTPRGMIAASNYYLARRDF